jgi:ribosome-binding protein aMBF1 (putative translation factor)
MLAHMRVHPTDLHVKIIIEMPNSKKISYISAENIGKLEAFLEKYSEEDDKPVAWEVLAKERIEKYKKAGLVLRGMRYREDLSQKELAKRSGVSQNEISKIENGKRTVGEKVAKRLAEALNIDYRLLTEI